LPIANAGVITTGEPLFDMTHSSTHANFSCLAYGYSWISNFNFFATT
jgi:hypothetical protein